jgi:hypothetical protein
MNQFMMAITEQINHYIQQLPESTQKEVLDFVEFLVDRSERIPLHEENSEWSTLSLSFAMRGMEEENGPEYTSDDIKEHFS